MKKILFLLLVSAVFSIGCSKKLITMNNLLKEKGVMDTTDNPARKRLVEKNLLTKRIELKNILVKDIIESTIIDYDFAVIVELMVDGKKIECYVYTKNLAMVARLKKGKSKINISGHFNRFFTMLDEYYTKIEIVEARISKYKPELKKKKK